MDSGPLRLLVTHQGRAHVVDAAGKLDGEASGGGSHPHATLRAGSYRLDWSPGMDEDDDRWILREAGGASALADYPSSANVSLVGDHLLEVGSSSATLCYLPTNDERELSPSAVLVDASGPRCLVQTDAGWAVWASDASDPALTGAGCAAALAPGGATVLCIDGGRARERGAFPERALPWPAGHVRLGRYRPDGVLVALLDRPGETVVGRWDPGERRWVPVGPADEVSRLLLHPSEPAVAWTRRRGEGHEVMLAVGDDAAVGLIEGRVLAFASPRRPPVRSTRPTWQEAEALWGRVSQGVVPAGELDPRELQRAHAEGRVLRGRYERYGFASGQVFFELPSDGQLSEVPLEQLVVLSGPLAPDDLKVLRANFWEHIDEVPGWPPSRRER